MELRESLRSRKHHLREYFRSKRISLSMLANFVGVSFPRINQIMLGYTPCPDWIETKLNDLVNLLEEE